MDPWCDVELVSGERILFGFAPWHPNTGGLSWITSTPLREFDAKNGAAATASGRHYELGRRIGLGDIPGEGEEAWISFELMIGGDAEDDEAVPPISADPARDRMWVTACKMARHLGLSPPGRAPSQVEAFHAENVDAYMLRMAAGRPV
jgi:hypothetical protein